MVSWQEAALKAAAAAAKAGTVAAPPSPNAQFGAAAPGFRPVAMLPMPVVLPPAVQKQALAAMQAHAARLQAAGEALNWPRREVRALVDAFGFIQQLRLASPREPGGGANQIAPASLNELERAFLKESFRQARRLQQKLQVRYQL